MPSAKDLTKEQRILCAKHLFSGRHTCRHMNYVGMLSELEIQRLEVRTRNKVQHCEIS